VVAIGVNAQGQRTILGAATGQSEDHQFWTSFLRSLIERPPALRGCRRGCARHMHFPREHRKRLHSTNPIERLHK